MVVLMNGRGQVVIPALLRRRLRLRQGSKVYIEERDGLLILRPLNRIYFQRMSGVLKGSGLLKALEESRRREAR